LLNLGMFRSRIFAFGNVSALLNSLARMAVTFLFVFYFIGARGYDHLTTGFLLTPLAGAMFLFAPLAGRLADRMPARVVSSAGMLVTAGGLLGMTTIDVRTPYWEIALWMIVVGAGSGIFNSPNTRAIMGSVSPERRGDAGGTRTLMVNVGAVLLTSLPPHAALSAHGTGLRGPYSPEFVEGKFCEVGADCSYIKRTDTLPSMSNSASTLSATPRG
jgi:MFS family permease